MSTNTYTIRTPRRGQCTGNLALHTVHTHPCIGTIHAKYVRFVMENRFPAVASVRHVFIGTVLCERAVHNIQYYIVLRVECILNTYACITEHIEEISYGSRFTLVYIKFRPPNRDHNSLLQLYTHNIHTHSLAIPYI